MGKNVHKCRADRRNQNLPMLIHRIIATISVTKLPASILINRVIQTDPETLYSTNNQQQTQFCDSPCKD